MSSEATSIKRGVLEFAAVGSDFGKFIVVSGLFGVNERTRAERIADLIVDMVFLLVVRTFVGLDVVEDQRGAGAPEMLAVLRGEEHRVFLGLAGLEEPRLAGKAGNHFGVASLAVFLDLTKEYSSKRESFSR